MRLQFAVLLLAAATCGWAHVGSPDIFLDAKAGPYALFITVQPPAVIPGIAQIQVRSAEPGLRMVTASPLPLTGEGAKHAPVPDNLQPDLRDRQTFNGALWLMQSGSFQIRVTVAGDAGSGTVSVPVPAIAQSTLAMPPALGLGLFALMCLLVVGLVGIIGAAFGEAQLAPGAPVSARQRKRSRFVMGGVFALLAAIVVFGNLWWKAEASDYNSYLYKPLEMTPSLDAARHRLTLTVKDPGWLRFRKIDDFIPDHGHRVHLYAIRQPELDRIYHLHPDITGPGVLQLELPSMPEGAYRLYADIVHQDGFPETMVAAIDVPEMAGRALEGDDSSAIANPVSQVQTTSNEFRLPDGYRMIFEKPPSLAARKAQSFRFRLLDPSGNPPADMGLYMGMLGHAAFVKTDGTVFAHVHPNGSIAMAAFLLAQPEGVMHEMAMGSEPAMNHESAGMERLPNSVAFPYGFPSPGRYRIFVQMKRGYTIETGVFDALVT